MDEVKMPSRAERYVPAVQTFGTRGILFHTAIARMVGLTLTEFNCLRLAARMDGATATDLARDLGLTLPAMTSIVDRLTELGFVRRERDTEDRRRVIIFVDKKAWAKVGAFYAGHSMQIGKLINSYTDAEFEFLIRYMEDVAELLRIELGALAEEAKRNEAASGPAGRSGKQAGNGKSGRRGVATEAKSQRRTRRSP